MPYYASYDPYSYPSSGSSSSRSTSSSGKEKFVTPAQPKGSSYPSGTSTSGSKSSSNPKPLVINGSPYYQDKDRRYKTQDSRYYP
ncbi:MAG: hypothetical protein LQ344_000357 [Seirophora lacunosa]|nr:MAG: hypothetical protein LQ344_000357 [Seirophora lacunosa]